MKNPTVIDSHDPETGFQLFKINLLENNINVIFFDNDIYGCSIDIPKTDQQLENGLIETIEEALNKMLKTINK